MIRLINSTEIAFLANVKRATVSMWKRRHKDFPRAVTHKLYNEDEVIAWLKQRERNATG